jgi:TolB-like protein
MKPINLLISCLAVMLVAACGSPNPELTKSPKTPGTELIVSNYQAMDQLLQKNQTSLNPAKPVLVTSLADINNLELSSPLGRVSSEQLASRLVGSGYAVVEVNMGNRLRINRGTGQLILSRDVRELSRERGAQAVVAGTFTVSHDDVFVNLKLLRAEDGRVLAAHDYILKMDENVRSMVTPVRRYTVY